MTTKFTVCKFKLLATLYFTQSAIWNPVVQDNPDGSVTIFFYFKDLIQNLVQISKDKNDLLVFKYQYHGLPVFGSRRMKRLWIVQTVSWGILLLERMLITTVSIILEFPGRHFGDGKSLENPGFNIPCTTGLPEWTSALWKTLKSNLFLARMPKFTFYPVLLV